MSMKRPRPSTSELRELTQAEDRATAYAQAVVKGELVAGPDIRNACKRHLRDLKNGHKRGLVWDLPAAQRVIGFFEDVLFLNGGDFEGIPFLCAPWQAFILGSLFGWKDSDGARRFRLAYIETAKGSGKSPLAAGIGLYGLMADDEARAEVYAAATKKDQAMILFRDAVAMYNQSPALASRLVPSGIGEKVWNLYYPKTASFFKPISADDGQSGPRPHIALLDEIHEHRNGNIVNMMRAGTKSRSQALIFMITNSGSDKTSVCWEYHEMGSRICAGKEHNDAVFAFICSIDKGDDPFRDESCWAKVNPSLDFILEGRKDGIPGRKYLREQIGEAQGMPSKEAVVRRLNFCEWTQAASPWISWEIWTQAEERVRIRLLRDRPCVAGLDLSSTTDLTSLVLLFYPTAEDPYWRLLPYFWIPEEGLLKREERDRVPYTQWLRERFLEVTPGRAVSKSHVLQRLVTICDFFDVRQIAYDRWRIEDLMRMIEDDGISLPELVPFGQGYRGMGPAIDEFELRLLGNQLRHDGNPVLTWCAGNAVTSSDPAGNRKVDKQKATGRIDGIVASIMAVGTSGTVAAGTGTSIYEDSNVSI